MRMNIQYFTLKNMLSSGHEYTKVFAFNMHAGVKSVYKPSQTTLLYNKECCMMMAEDLESQRQRAIGLQSAIACYKTQADLLTEKVQRQREQIALLSNDLASREAQVLVLRQPVPKCQQS